tara:strand:- start:13 stop:1011 length:999 start_codon:yes stop_codon:yes gene_type:complete
MSVQSGSIRFNTDSSKLEIYNGEQWWEIDTTSPYEQTGGTRAVFIGGGSPYAIDFMNISSLGNSATFGTSLSNAGYVAAASSRTRGIGGGDAPSSTNTIQFITFASTGDGQDFGDMTTTAHARSAVSNGTRGVIACGNVSPTDGNATNIIDYVTIAQLGNAVDFGDAVSAKRDRASCASPTRGVLAAGYNGDPVSGSQTNAIEYITMSTLGNGSDFGDLTEARMGGGGASNAIRGIFGGGHPAKDVMDSIEIATLGNAVDFGDLIRGQFRGGTASSSTRYVYFGGNNSPYREIQYVQFATRGNTVDFGDYSPSNQRYDINEGGCSNGHGGLG